MSFLDAALVVALGGLFIWAIVNQRGRLRREVDLKLRSVVKRTRDGEVEFDGAFALVLLKDYAHLGTEDSGPYVSAKFLCKMPGAGCYWVVVVSGSETAPANVELSELSQVEVDDVVKTYPYLKHLTSNLTRSS